MFWPPTDPQATYPAKMSSQNPKNETIALGVDVGATRTKLGLVSRQGEIVAYREIATEAHHLELFIQRLLQEIHTLLENNQEPVIGIGITFCGWINEERTRPFFCPNFPALHDFHFKELLESEFHLPVVAQDDVTAHTLAEYTFGVGHNCRRFLCLAIGTGLSAGVIVNGKSLDFTGGCAGDTGHIILRPGGPQCASGCKGCAEAFIGVAGIERLWRERYNSYRPAYEIIRDTAQGTDPRAMAVMQQIGSYVGELLASLFPIFVPDRIALSGGTAQAGNILLDATLQRFEDIAGGYCRTYANVPGSGFTGVDIVLGRFKGESGVIGAVVDLFRFS